MEKKYNNRLFWIFQVTGWAIYGLTMYGLFSKSKSNDYVSMALFYLSYLLGFLMTSFILRYVYRFVRKKVKNIVWLIIAVFVAIMIFVPIWYFTDISISSIWWKSEYTKKFIKTFSLISYLRNNYMQYVVYFGWTALYFSIKYWIEWQSERKRSEDAYHLAQKAQFQMLRYQLNPHFLFNSLNSIKALVDEDSRSAKQMINDLSEFLRYSLINNDTTYRPLQDELDALKLYLEIEKKRFEEKLQITYEITKETESKEVLSFLIHPIIENAIKYGMKTSQMPLRLSIKSFLERNFLIIEICNSGYWFDNDDIENYHGTGTGLLNVEKRLKNAYQDNFIFEIIKEEQSVCIKIGMISEND